MLDRSLAPVSEWIKGRPNGWTARAARISPQAAGPHGVDFRPSPRHARLQCEMLLDFLAAIECETLYLVGDIVDGWRLSRGWYWPDAHNEVVRRVLKMAHRGTRVVLIAGNHDEMLRPYAGMTFGGVELALDTIHETADGRRLLVTHGDGFDGVVLYARWLAFLGDTAYGAAAANRWVNLVRRQFKLPYWSLSAYMKKRVKNAVQFICDFEEAVAHAARDMGVDGVVCGHIHCAEIRQIGDVTYYNDGDWVESCTALVEDFTGAMSIVDWVAEQARLNPAPVAQTERAALPVPRLNRSHEAVA
jgi:UDP-2,3-diacylglucosamine pyrophosphatase LpxH